MSIKTSLGSGTQEVKSIVTSINGEIKPVSRVYTFVEGVRKLVWPSESTLLYEKTTAGTFEYTIPTSATSIKIEIGGGKGGRAYAAGYAFGEGGWGEVVQISSDIVGSLTGKKITGKIGAQATSTTGAGADGYTRGGNGQSTDIGGGMKYAGGGGGSTGITIDGTKYEASGGGGASLNGYYGGNWYIKGGKGGGPKGGEGGPQVAGSLEVTNGKNATGDLTSTQPVGYIRVWSNSASDDKLWTKNTPGYFEYTIPSTISKVQVVIAAGNGAQGNIGGYSDGNIIRQPGGKGGVKKIIVNSANGKKITGVIGQSGGPSEITQNPGSPDGSAGQVQRIDNPPSYSYGGGGGGSSYVMIDGVKHTVSGGAGGAAFNGNVGWAQGGNGGGPKAGKITTNGKGGNATDGDELNETNVAYIAVYNVI